MWISSTTGSSKAARDSETLSNKQNSQSAHKVKEFATSKQDWFNPWSPQKIEENQLHSNPPDVTSKSTRTTCHKGQLSAPPAPPHPRVLALLRSPASRRQKQEGHTRVRPDYRQWGAANQRGRSKTVTQTIQSSMFPLLTVKDGEAGLSSQHSGRRPGQMTVSLRTAGYKTGPWLRKQKS